MKPKLASLLLALTAAIRATAVHAEEPPIDVENLDLENLLDLEVTAATKSSVPLSEAPAVGSVLTRDQIDDFGWNSLNELLWSQPGFFRAQEYERRLVGINGVIEDWNNNRLLLLVDGLPANHVETGTAFTMEQTPLFMARRVEVLRGPGSALYGSYALSGVVSLETVDAADLGDHHAEARLRLGPDSRMLDVLGAHDGAHAALVIGYNTFGTTGQERSEVDWSGRTDAEGELARFPLSDRHGSEALLLKLSGKDALDGLVLTLQHQSWHYGTYLGWLSWAPDGHERMEEERQLLSLRWRSPDRGAWRAELAAQYQRYAYRLDTRHYPAGAFDGFYPDGVNEIVDSDTDSLFLRAQAKRLFAKGAELLVAVEYTGILYDGDREHVIDVDITDPDAPPLPGGMALGGIYEPIDGRLASKVGALIQVDSGELLGARLRLTGGLRWDGLFFRYAQPGEAVTSDAMQMLSPRLAAIWRAHDDLTLKLMAARAFRTPNIVELFAANTWTAGAADIPSMKAEHQDTAELAADWSATAALRLRAHLWLAHLSNQIGYAEDQESVMNRKDDTRFGGSLEALFESKLGQTRLDGFASYSLVLLLDEELVDPGLAPSERLTSAPSHLVKAAGRLRHGRFTLTLDAMLQGSVARRDSELLTDEYRALRPDTVPAWVTVNAAVKLRLNSWARVGVSVNNLFGSQGRLSSGLDTPFDYRVDPRRVLGELLLTL